MRAHGLLHKRVVLPWAGGDLQFWLSQSLFSGDDIDTGTRALLDTIAERLGDLPVRRALDLGSGSGVIGVALSRLWPRAHVILSDRDALAVSVSALNARENDGSRAAAIGCLGVPAARGPFDLIAANLPAKVGEPVLRLLVRQAAAAAPEGHLALVVIRPRQDVVERALQGRARILHRRELRAHTVLVAETAMAAPGDPPPGRDGLAAYLRGDTEFRYGGQAVRLQTAWGLPDFDAVPYSLRAAEPLVCASALGPRVLIWNPGQGLTACSLAATGGARPAITVGSRDLLQIETARRNLRHHGVAAAGLHAPSIADATGPGPRGSARYSAVVATHGETDGPWWRWIPEAVDALLAPEGRLLLIGSSTPVDRALRSLREQRSPGERHASRGWHSSSGCAATGMVKRQDRRRRGYRAVLLQRRVWQQRSRD
ncbi:MAG: methyltransferase [Spirochaetaceae bacterium]|nr:methyltransferase [Spirochaetaceae bacterium]